MTIPMPPKDLRPGSIPFTQYMRPDGREKPVWWEPSSPQQQRLGEALLARGVVFTTEELQTGEASFTAELGDDVLAHEVCPNGPLVVDAVERLIVHASMVLEDVPEAYG